MISVLISIAILAACTAAFFTLLDLCLQLFDWVLKQVPNILNALKVLILGRDGRVSEGVLVGNTKGQVKLITGDQVYENAQPVNIDTDVPPQVQQAFKNAPVRTDGKKIVGAKIAEQAERAVIRRH